MIYPALSFTLSSWYALYAHSSSFSTVSNPSSCGISILVFPSIPRMITMSRESGSESPAAFPAAISPEAAWSRTRMISRDKPFPISIHPRFTLGE